MTVRQLAKYWLYNSVPGFSGRFPYFGTPVHFPKHAVVFRAVCEQGIFEREIVQRMVKLAKPRTTVFDVGANLGLMSVPVLEKCGDCRVVSFEPSPNSLPFLERTRAGSAYRDRWTVIGAAVADGPGELDFTIGSGRDALFEGFRPSDRISGSKTIKVPVTTLDETWHRLQEPMVSLIKIDVEGAEAGVLRGATALLDRCRPAVVVEWVAAYLERYQTPTSELLQAAQRHHYRIFTIPGGVPVDDERALTAQMIDCDNFLLLAA